MVVGTGLMGEAFKRLYCRDDEVIIYCAGVSKSGEVSEAEFSRELALLDPLVRSEKTLVYFSSSSVDSQENRDVPYYLHKRRIEEKLISRGSSYIFRLCQVAGKTGNPATLTNFLFNRILERERFYVFPECRRSIIDVEDCVSICDHIIKNQRFSAGTYNISSGLKTKIEDIVEIFEGLAKKKALYYYERAEESPEPNSEICAKIAVELKVKFDSSYLQRTLEKYYGQ